MMEREDWKSLAVFLLGLVMGIFFTAAAMKG
jgi:hypothetical protein